MVANPGNPRVGVRSGSLLATAIFRAGFCLVLLLSALGGIFHAATARAQSVSKEYQVKAAFLFNFAQFVQWPSNAFTGPDEPFSIGIMGDDPFGPALEQIVQGETIHNRKLVIVRSHRAQDLAHCQLVFISKSERGRTSEILPKLAGRGTLTVSELPGFTTHGGAINFFLEGNKVRFEINPAAAQREGLKISSQLLNLGKIVAIEPAKSGA